MGVHFYLLLFLLPNNGCPFLPFRIFTIIDFHLLIMGVLIAIKIAFFSFLTMGVHFYPLVS